MSSTSFLEYPNGVCGENKVVTGGFSSGLSFLGISGCFACVRAYTHTFSPVVDLGSSELLLLGTRRRRCRTDLSIPFARNITVPYESSDED
ncbi:hypothetical protein ABZP36_015042 [Zizania latifolia]